MVPRRPGSNSRRVKGAAVIGTIAASALALGLAVPQAAGEVTSATISGLDPQGNMSAAKDDAANKCQERGGTPGQYVEGRYRRDGTAIATILCIYP